MNKSLYGLKQAPRASCEKIDTHFSKNGSRWCRSDPNMYVKVFEDDVLIVVLYVDDLILTINHLSLIMELKNDLKKCLEMTYIGLLH